VSILEVAASQTPSSTALQNSPKSVKLDEVSTMLTFDLNDFLKSPALYHSIFVLPSSSPTPLLLEQLPFLCNIYEIRLFTLPADTSRLESLAKKFMALTATQTHSVSPCFIVALKSPMEGEKLAGGVLAQLFEFLNFIFTEKFKDWPYNPTKFIAPKIKT
jgi:hypothetical protein